MYDEKFMRRAIELSAQALETPGARPYGAVVVKDGRIVGEGLNQSAKNFDPTSHGEVEAIRDACRNLKTTDLSGADLYTSCEPCSVASPPCDGRDRPHVLRRVAGPIRRGRAAPAAAAAARSGARAGRTAGGAARHAPAEQKLGDEAVAVLKAWVQGQK